MVEERSRIARELHDVISHSVSVMVVQAGAARHTLDSQDTEMCESLQAIETAGREALAELRRLLGILRRPDDEPALAPVPGLARVGVLIEQMREAGLPTELRIEGEPADIAPGVDLTAYRIIEEALTMHLHAGPAQAQVIIRTGPMNSISRSPTTAGARRRMPTAPGRPGGSASASRSRWDARRRAQRCRRRPSRPAARG